MDKLLNRSLKLANILLPSLIALILGAIAILIAGASPMKVYSSIVDSAFFSLEGICNTLVYAVPLIMIGESLVIAFRGGVFNMGSEGQMYMGALFGAVVGFSVTGLPSWLHILLCLATGTFCGALWALLPALLRTYLRINELVSTIMLNYVAISICNFLTNGPFKYSYQYTSTAPVLPSAELPVLFEGYTLTWAIIIALLVALGTWILMKKTVFGYRVDMLGYQREFTEASGMNARKKTLQVFLISGALAGLTGATVILSVYKRFTPSFSANPGLGWDGMMVAMLGNSTPIGTVIAGILFGAFKFGGVSLQVKFGIPIEVIRIVQSSLMLFLSVRFIDEKTNFIRKLVKKLQDRKTQKKTEGSS